MSYSIKDTHTGETISTHSNRARARGKAERMNQTYGAIRYIVTLA